MGTSKQPRSPPWLCTGNGPERSLAARSGISTHGRSTQRFERLAWVRSEEQGAFRRAVKLIRPQSCSQQCLGKKDMATAFSFYRLGKFMFWVGSVALTSALGKAN